jgi:hypothetical protein
MSEELKKFLERAAKGENLGNYKLSKELQDELTQLTGSLGGLVKLKDEFGFDTINDGINALGSAISQVSNGESYLDTLRTKIKRGEVTERFSAGYNTLLNLAQVGTSAAQIARSNDQLGGLQRPAMPTPPSEDRALGRSIYEAQQGTFDTARAAQAASNKIINQRLAADEAVRQVSRGQGAQYQAGRQANSLAAMAAMGELTPMIDAIRAREQARLDELLAMRQQNRQMDFRNRLNLYDRGIENYMNDYQMAAELGATGRQNLYSSLGSLGSNLAVGAGYANFQNPLRKNRTGDPVIDNFDQQATANLARSVSNERINPYSTDYLTNRLQVINPFYGPPLKSVTPLQNGYDKFMADMDGVDMNVYRTVPQRIRPRY